MRKKIVSVSPLSTCCEEEMTLFDEFIKSSSWAFVESVFKGFLTFPSFTKLYQKAMTSKKISYTDPEWKKLLDYTQADNPSAKIFQNIPSIMESSLLDTDPMAMIVGYEDVKSELKAGIKVYVNNVAEIHRHLLQIKNGIVTYLEKTKQCLRLSDALGIPLERIDPQELIPFNSPIYLLYGDFGVGKSEIARAVKKCIANQLKELSIPSYGVLFLRRGESISAHLVTEAEARKSLSDYHFRNRVSTVGWYGCVSLFTLGILFLNAYVLSRIQDSINVAIPGSNYCRVPPPLNSTLNGPVVQPVNVSPSYRFSWITNHYFTSVSPVAYAFGVILITFALHQLNHREQRDATPHLYVKPDSFPPVITGNIPAPKLFGVRLSRNGRTPQTQIGSSILANALFRTMEIENLDRLDRGTQEKLGSPITNHYFNIAGDSQLKIPSYFFGLFQTNFKEKVSSVLSKSDRAKAIRMDSKIPIMSYTDSLLGKTGRHFLLRLKYYIESASRSQHNGTPILPLDDLAMSALFLLLLRHNGTALKMNRMVFQTIKTASTLAVQKNRDLVDLESLLDAFEQIKHRKQDREGIQIQTWEGLKQFMDVFRMKKRLFPFDEHETESFFNSLYKKKDDHHSTTPERIKKALISAQKKAEERQVNSIGYEELRLAWNEIA